MNARGRGVAPVRNLASQIPTRQRKLRDACRRGDLRAIKALLEPSAPNAVTKFLRVFLGATILQTLGLEIDAQPPAALDYVYCDDDANLPIHYISSGRIGVLERFASMLRGGSFMSAWVHNAEMRAEALRGLLDSPAYAVHLNLSAVNARLETPLHCSLRSCSAPVAKALLERGVCFIGPISPRLQTESMVRLDSADADGWVPLDIAVATASWSVVAELLKDNAHKGFCPGLQAAEKRLSPWTSRLPKLRRLGGGKPRPHPRTKEGLLKAVSRHLVSAAGSAIGYNSNEGLVEKAEAAEAAEAAPPRRAVVYSDSLGVVDKREAAVQDVAAATGLGSQAALALLVHHSGNAECAMNAYKEDACASLQEAGVVLAAEEALQQDQPGNAACIVCFDDVAAADVSISMACGHVCCDSCWRGMLQARLDEGDVHRTCCPAEGCRAPLTVAGARRILAGDSADVDRYLRLLGQRVVDASPSMQWCPRPGCGRALELAAEAGAAGAHPSSHQQQPRKAPEGGSDVGIPVRCDCGHTFCWDCRRAEHSPAGCNHVRRWNELLQRMMEENEETTKDLLRTTTQGCPRCKARIERTGGCNHMTCSNCGHHFCWMCLGDWKDHNYDTGGYYSCNRFQEQAAASALRGAPSSSGGHRQTQAKGGVIESLVKAFQQPFEERRLSHFMRRYASHNQVELAQLMLTADRIDKILQGSGLSMNESMNESGGPCRPSLQEVAQAAAEGHQMLANSYILAYFMSWGSCRSYFEDLQDILEQAVESLSMPLAMYPRTASVEFQAGRLVSQAANIAISHRAVRIESARQPGNTLQCLQFYHTLVLHTHAEDVASLVAAVRRQCSDMAQKAQRGIFARACGSTS